MVENKKGFISCLILTILSGIIPIFLNSGSKVFSYLLALFGSALLSLIICFINYRTQRKQLLSSIIFPTYYFEIHSKIQTDIINNGLSKNQIIEICSYARDVLKKEFDKINLFLKGLFPILDKKLKKLLLDYKEDLLNNYYDKFVEIYIFITTCDEMEIQEVKKEFENYLFNLVTYNGFTNKLTIIEDFVYKKKDEYLKNFNPDTFNEDMKKKFKDFKEKTND